MSNEKKFAICPKPECQCWQNLSHPKQECWEEANKKSNPDDLLDDATDRIELVHAVREKAWHESQRPKRPRKPRETPLTWESLLRFLEWLDDVPKEDAAIISESDSGRVVADYIRKKFLKK